MLKFNLPSEKSTFGIDNFTNALEALPRWKRGRFQVSGDPGSTVPRRQLGRHLRQLREDALITLKAAAEALEWSPQKLWRIENGATSMRSLDVDAMCRVYGASPEMTSALTALAKETKAKGWWHAYGDGIPGWFELYVGLEAATSGLRHYAPELVPGLLQIPEYIAAVTRLGFPELNPSEVERRVALRLGRQKLLARNMPAAPDACFVLNEAVLLRGAGDRPAMVTQLRHLMTMATRPNVSVRVLPMSAGLHPAAFCGEFTILEFPTNGNRAGEPTTIYSESLTGALYLDKPAEVKEYEDVWAALMEASLDEVDSLSFINRMVEEAA
jgi:transcriptional regulator with XRE-family HTH domain